MRAQIDRYREHIDDDIWIMPSTNHSKIFTIVPETTGGPSGLLAIVFVDTTTLAPSENKCCNENGFD